MFLARRNAVVGVVLLTLGIVYGLLTASLPNRSLPDIPGPSFFPWLITGAFVVLSGALLISAFIGSDNDSTEPIVDSNTKLRMFALIWIVVYFSVLPYAGFLVASAPFFAGMMWFYGERNRTVILLSAVLIPGGLFYVFRYGFQILLPTGVW